jgi:hypothetical protein
MPTDSKSEFSPDGLPKQPAPALFKMYPWARSFNKPPKSAPRKSILHRPALLLGRRRRGRVNSFMFPYPLSIDRRISSRRWRTITNGVPPALLEQPRGRTMQRRCLNYHPPIPRLEALTLNDLVQQRRDSNIMSSDGSSSGFASQVSPSKSWNRERRSVGPLDEKKTRLLQLLGS